MSMDAAAEFSSAVVQDLANGSPAMALGGPSDPTPATKAKDRLGRPHSRGAKGRFVKGNGDAAKASARLAADKAWLPDIDAISTVFKRYREIASAIVDDQQGVQLAETMKSLIKRFAAAEVLSEQIDARITRTGSKCPSLRFRRYRQRWLGSRAHRNGCSVASPKTSRRRLSNTSRPSGARRPDDADRHLEKQRSPTRRRSGGVIDGPSWIAQRSLLLAAVGEELTDAERAKFKQLTQREREPSKAVEEMVWVKGRRAGGSRAAAVLVAYVAGLCKHPALVKGERGVALIISPDQRQATIILDYLTAIFEGSPILRQLVESRTQTTLRLNNGIDIEVRASDFRRLRGLTFLIVVADEFAFWLSSEYSANPDSAILAAVRPGLATTSGMLVMISSPYARVGELWRAFEKNFGPNGDPLVLVAKGSSRDFNPTLAQSVVDRAYERDPASADAEFGGNFRRDIQSLFTIEVVRARVSHGVRERAPERGVSYVGFVDPSGGSADSFTLCIGHNDRTRQTIVVDALREVRAPFSPESVCEEFSVLLKSYRVHRISGDRFAGLWPVEVFAKFGVVYEQNARPKSDLYQALLPLINSGRIDLLDNPRLVNQLVGLERRTARGGRDSVDHAPGGMDDVSNAVAGLAALCPMVKSFFGPGSHDTTGPDIDEGQHQSGSQSYAELMRKKKERPQ